MSPIDKEKMVNGWEYELLKVASEYSELQTAEVIYLIGLARKGLWLENNQSQVVSSLKYCSSIFRECYALEIENALVDLEALNG